MHNSYSLRLTELLQRLIRNLHIHGQALAMRRKLCMSECRVLFLLRSGRPMEMTDIRSCLRITGAFTTDIVDRLVKHELVTRTKGRADRRKIILCLTKRGRKCLKQLEADRNELLFRFFAKMKTKDKKSIEAGIIKLLEAMEPVKEG